MDSVILLELGSLLIPISIAAIVIADLILLRKYEYIQAPNLSKSALVLWVKRSFIVSAVILILSLIAMLISVIHGVGVSLLLFICFVLGSVGILGILSLPWIIYETYLLIRLILKK